MIGAIKQPNGKYTLVDITYVNKFNSTFRRKEQIKQFGGVWDNDKKHWYDFPEDKLKEIGASKRLKIRIEPYPGSDKSVDCHEYEFNIINNTVRRMDWGDCWVYVKVEEIYGEG